jgi:4-amino-4-deoxy-L-arabinose transferase-like glycosyltransferase
MARKERLQFLLTWLGLGVLPLLLRPLWQPDEGRYAEIPREMLATGDWLTPHLNYVLYFEKPPFQYWVSAIFMNLFGESAFVVRLPLALAAFLTMYAVWRLAKRLGCPWPVWASFSAMSCLLLYSCGQILTLDALFSSLCVFSLAAAVEAVSIRYRGDAGGSERKAAIGWTLAFFVSAGCALLTKGPVVLVIVGGALFFSLFFVWKDEKLRAAVVKTLFSPYGWLVFAAISVPWFVLVNKANPGHAHFFFYTEHFERFTTHKHARQGSDNPILDKLYFAPVLIAGLLPWLSACFVGVKRGLKFIGIQQGPIAHDAPLNRWAVALLLAAFAWPVLFFSASGSKLIPYIMPCIVPLIAIAVAFEGERNGFLPFKRAGIELLLLAAIFLAAALLVLLSPMGASAKWIADLQRGNGGPWILFLGIGFALVGAWGIRGDGLTATRWMVWHSVLLILLTIAAQRVNGHNGAIDALVAKAPKENVLWISHGNYFQALPFLTKGRVVLVGGAGELAYGKNRMAQEEQDRWFIEDRQALTSVAQRLQIEHPGRPVWALSDNNAWRDLATESKLAWEAVDASSKTILLRYVGVLVTSE